MAAHPAEHNCECHWGSAEDLALLKTADAPLDDDLLRRAYEATDWKYPDPMLRRILPPLTRALAAGTAPPDMIRAFALAAWQDWPPAERDAVQDFLSAWWRHVLTSADAPPLAL